MQHNIKDVIIKGSRWENKTSKKANCRRKHFWGRAGWWRLHHPKPPFSLGVTFHFCFELGVALPPPTHPFWRISFRLHTQSVAAVCAPESRNDLLCRFCSCFLLWAPSDWDGNCLCIAGIIISKHDSRDAWGYAIHSPSSPTGVLEVSPFAGWRDFCFGMFCANFGVQILSGCWVRTFCANLYRLRIFCRFVVAGAKFEVRMFYEILGAVSHRRSSPKDPIQKSYPKILAMDLVREAPLNNTTSNSC